MEPLLKDPMISEFLSHYPTNQWINLLKVLTHHSIHLLMRDYPGEYPTPNELLSLFERTSAASNLLGDITGLYWNLHKVNKKIKKIVEWNIVDGMKIAEEQLKKRKDSIDLPQAIENSLPKYKHIRNGTYSTCKAKKNSHPGNSFSIFKEGSGVKPMERKSVSKHLSGTVSVNSSVAKENITQLDGLLKSEKSRELKFGKTLKADLSDLAVEIAAKEPGHKKNLQSSNERYDAWLSKNSDWTPSNFSKRSSLSSTQAGIFNKFTTLIANHNAKSENMNLTVKARQLIKECQLKGVPIKRPVNDMYCFIFIDAIQCTELLWGFGVLAVSYTHLTLPTICSV
eukprot:TRINITY_DN967_c0_g4_i2.p1 TRINITY_DN967_c0_g4~~TRINITY_DN967_c0_g4_i2.p1  ORF type:complete len:340 (-),score=54.94 TRINITY_DN967_c0_g4_i2:47-1066(-)